MTWTIIELNTLTSGTIIKGPKCAARYAFSLNCCISRAIVTRTLTLRYGMTIMFYGLGICSRDIQGVTADPTTRSCRSFRPLTNCPTTRPNRSSRWHQMVHPRAPQAFTFAGISCRKSMRRAVDGGNLG